MRIVYVADAQIPGRSTSGIQVMQMCAAFARQGADVTLVHPRRFWNRPEGYNGNLWQFYGVSPRFAITTLPTPLTLGLSKQRRLARVIRLGPAAVYVLARTRPGKNTFICYSRSLLGSWLMLKVRAMWGTRSACRGVFVELHDRPSGATARRAVAAADGIVTISRALYEQVVSDIGISPDRIWVEPDGFNPQAIGLDAVGREEARRRLELRQVAGPLVAYTGRAIAGKGVDILLRAAPAIAQIGGSVLIVGKVYEPEYERLARSLPNVTCTGFRPPAEIPLYLAAADVLALPTTPDLSYAEYTSPLKLFEYMASARPIVASNLPVFREVLSHEVNALLYPPKDPEGLAMAVGRLWSSRALRERVAERARRDVQHWSWDRRAERILDHVSSITS